MKLVAKSRDELVKNNRNRGSDNSRDRVRDKRLSVCEGSLEKIRVPFSFYLPAESSAPGFGRFSFPTQVSSSLVLGFIVNTSRVSSWIDQRIEFKIAAMTLPVASRGSPGGKGSTARTNE
jgi:hypothetical protein